VLDAEGNVYFGTNGAKVFALNAETGKQLWRNSDPTFSIESKPAVSGERVYVGAWDGNLYCMDRKSGKTLWKQPGPYCQKSGKLNRYYAPADNGPVAVGDSVCITDRGYAAGTYKADGSYAGPLTSGCSALTLASDAKSLFVRSTGKPLSRMDLTGKPLWTSTAKSGSFAISPTEADGLVYVCSNAGELSAVDAATGALKWQYQASPKLYVFTGVAASNGVAFLASMDGYVTAVQPIAPKR
jgi:outer membrane protein assembly factor BamB